MKIIQAFCPTVLSFSKYGNIKLDGYQDRKSILQLLVGTVKEHLWKWAMTSSFWWNRKKYIYKNTQIYIYIYIYIYLSVIITCWVLDSTFHELWPTIEQESFMASLAYGFLQESPKFKSWEIQEIFCINAVLLFCFV